MAISTKILKPTSCYAPGSFNYQNSYDSNDTTYAYANVGGSNGTKELTYTMPSIDSYGVINKIEFILLHQDITSLTTEIFEPTSGTVISSLVSPTGPPTKIEKVIDITNNFKGKVGIRFSATTSGVQPSIYEVGLKITYEEKTKNIKIGNLDVSKIMIGDTVEVKKAYIGNTLIFG